MSLANDGPDQADTADVLRERAAHVRRLMVELVWETDRSVLRDYADELEARAAVMERGES
jgi:hypothetical protein